MVTIRGTILQFISGEPKHDGWRVARLKLELGDDTLKVDGQMPGAVKVSGNMTGMRIGDRVSLFGELVDTKKWGVEFKFLEGEILDAIVATGVAAVLTPGPPATAVVDDDSTITGTVSDIWPHKAGTDWRPFDVVTDGKTVRCTGEIPGVGVGQRITAQGKEDGSHWDKEFRVTSYTLIAPESAREVMALLAGTVNGLGDKKQDRILDALGDRLIAILAGDKDLAVAEFGSIPRIGFSLGQLIVDAWINYGFWWADVRPLQEAGLGGAVAFRAHVICRERDVNILDTLKTTPHLFCQYVPGITFQMGERMWIAVGRPESGKPIRAKQALCQTLIDFEVEDGHTCMPLRTVLLAASEKYSVDETQLDRVARQLALGLDVRIESHPLTREDTIWRGSSYNDECRIAEILHTVSQTKPTIVITPEQQRVLVEYAIAQLPIDNLSPEKRLAIETALRSKVSILSGAAGSGKTTVLYGIYAAYRRLGLKISMAAPTGRAAKRLQEVTGHAEATTIHRLLGYNPVTKKYKYGRGNPLEADVLFLEEAGMVGTQLLLDILAAVAPHTRLIFVGDCRQLESVDHGAVLRDLINSNTLPHVHLTQVFRQGEGSGILVAAKAVLCGTVPTSSSDCPIESTHESHIANLVEQRVRTLMEHGVLSGDIQVLAPTYPGTVGIIQLNTRLQNRLNPNKQSLHKQQKTRGDYVYWEEFRSGDRVLQLRNNYELGLYNGDRGVVIDRTATGLLIKFGETNSLTDYPLSWIREDLALGYAMSIHKAQGSQFPHVVLVGARMPRMWTKNLLYTGITRAQETCLIVAETGVIENAVTSEQPPRQTMLEHRIAKQFARSEPPVLSIQGKPGSHRQHEQYGQFQEDIPLVDVASTISRETRPAARQSATSRLLTNGAFRTGSLQWSSLTPLCVEWTASP